MEVYQVCGLAVYRFESEWIGTNMFVLICKGNALIVDPHPDDEALDLLKKENIEELSILLTHEHPDHTHGVPWFLEHFVTKLICSRATAEAIKDERNNRPLTIALSVAEKDKENGTNLLSRLMNDFGKYECHADTVFDDIFSFEFAGVSFEFTATPGHSKGSCCIRMNDAAVFTGDNLIWNTPVITRFPGGNLKEFNEKTKPYLDALPEDITVFPGHGRTFQMKEVREKAA